MAMAYIQERKGKDGKPNYRVQVRKKGYPIQTATFERKTDAKKWAQSIEVAIDERRYRNVAQAKRHTLGELIDRYIENYLPQKPSSAPLQLQQLNWWKQQIGALTLADLTPDIIAEHRDKLARRIVPSGKKISPSTVNRYLAALSHVLTVGEKELRWLPDSPIRHVSKLKEPQGRVRYLSDEERMRLLEACAVSENQYLKTIVILALSTGMRKNEILPLRWEDVDLDRQVIILKKTKNKERRAVPIVGKAHEMVRELAAKAESHSLLLFPGDNLSKPIAIKRAWYTAVRRAKLEDFRFHDLRHSAASYLAMNGATLPEIAEVLGHKTYDMVKRYAHLSTPHVTSVVERMNEKLFKDNPS
jgi:integrase